MGQKVNPKGIRLGIVKDWDSKWYANSTDYPKYLLSDINVRDFLFKELTSASVSRISIERLSNNAKIIIHTARPGIVIGKGGEEVTRLKAEVAQLTEKEVQINISEIKRPELDAALVGANIAHQLIKKISYRRVVSKAIQATMRMGAQGIRVNVAGRLGGAEIARSEKFAEGRIPLHTIRADIDYALTEAHSTYGIIGIKVWICLGTQKNA